LITSAVKPEKHGVGSNLAISSSCKYSFCRFEPLEQQLISDRGNSAIGGAIGTGLFVGSGSILALAGPAPLFMGYLTLMFAVWNVMQILCEMVVYLPYKGYNLEQV
jgi:hypothetical protein